MSKDYYKILGIAEFESAENIKSAYRKLARKFHPDIAGNSKESLLKFKEINEAYEILSNKIKKEEYDKARRFYNYSSENYTRKETKEKTNTSNPNKMDNKFSFNWEDFLHNLNQVKNNTKKEQKFPKKGSDIYSDIEISINDVINGASKTINMLQSSICPKCKGKKFANGCLCERCKGKGYVNEYKKFTVKIPAGIKDKSKIRLAGEGNKGLNGGTNGDLYLTIHIKNEKIHNDTLNVEKKLPITPFEAVLGATIKIATSQGIVSVNIAPNTQNGQKIRLANCGLVQNNKIGDMILCVEIRIPNNLSKEEINLYKKLEELSTSDIRQNY